MLMDKLIQYRTNRFYRMFPLRENALFSMAFHNLVRRELYRAAPRLNLHEGHRLDLRRTVNRTNDNLNDGPEERNIKKLVNDLTVEAVQNADAGVYQGSHSPSSRLTGRKAVGRVFRTACREEPVSNVCSRSDIHLIACFDVYILSRNVDVAIGSRDIDARKRIQRHITHGRLNHDRAGIRRGSDFIQPIAVADRHTTRQGKTLILISQYIGPNRHREETLDQRKTWIKIVEEIAAVLVIIESDAMTIFRCDGTVW